MGAEAAGVERPQEEEESTDVAGVKLSDVTEEWEPLVGVDAPSDPWAEAERSSLTARMAGRLMLAPIILLT